MLALLAISFSSSPSNANPAHCVANPLNTSNAIDVYLNYDSFQHLHNDKSVLGGLTLDESIGVVLQALEEWNHSLIAVGHYDWHITGKAFSAGVRSDVAPAVACKAGVAGTRDCMVAYTDIADPKNSVRFRRFDVAFDGTRVGFSDG